MATQDITIPKKEIAPGVFTTGGVATIPQNTPASATISAQDLKPQTPINLTGTFQQPTDMGTGLVASGDMIQQDIQKYLDATNQPQTETQSLYDQLIGSVSTASEGLTGRGASQTQAEQQTGFTQANKELADLNAQYLSKKAEYDKLNANIEAGAGRQGLTTSQMTGQQGAVNRAAAADLGLLQAQILGKQGQVEQAQNAANRAVDLMYQDREAVYNTKLKQLELIKDKLTGEESKRAKALEYALNKEKENSDDTKAIAIEAAKNGASSDVIKAITNAKDYKEAINMAGNSFATSQNEIVKLDNGSTIVVNKKTGEIVSRLGGGKSTTNNQNIVARQVNGVPVAGYTLVAGDDPYFIAQQYGTTVAELKKLNPNVKDWNNIQVGATLNVPQAEQDAFLQSLKATSGGKAMADTSIQKLDKGLTVLNQLGVLQSNVQGLKTGPIVGVFKSKNPWDTQAQTIKTSLNAIVPNLARGVYGEVGVLTDNDIKTYSKTIPNLTSTEDVRNAVLYITLDMIGKSIKNTLSVNAAAGRDVSGFTDIYTEMESTKNSILSSIPGAQVPQAFQQQDEFLSQFSSGVSNTANNKDFFGQFNFSSTGI